jgi:hypothetical protein
MITIMDRQYFSEWLKLGLLGTQQNLLKVLKNFTVAFWLPEIHWDRLCFLLPVS